MSDRSSFTRGKFEKIHLESTVSRKTIVKKYKKNVKRKNRRKRSRKTYFNMLKKQRTTRSAQELCNSLQDFNVVDMDVKAIHEFTKLPQEVAEWQNKEQIAYWKSRAVSLEIENKMLRQHLRNVYAQQVEYYESNKDWQEVTTSCPLSKPDDNKLQSKEMVVTEQVEAAGSSKVLPKEPIWKNRLKEMEKIYGDIAPKIMGMETAIELNYERLLEDGSPNYWPDLPLKL